jgi:dynein heavy chain, axonemal
MKSVEDYLLLKRLVFPRMYFLSNDELLDLLSQGRTPRAIEVHLTKCFSGVHRLNFTVDGPAVSDIASVISTEV